MNPIFKSISMFAPSPFPVKPYPSKIKTFVLVYPTAFKDKIQVPLKTVFGIGQEYVIYKNGKNIGRADLLVYDNKHSKYFVFEAKKKPAFPAPKLTEWMNNFSTENLSNVIKQQVLIFFHAEQGFYEERSTKPYLYTIYFEVISNVTESSQINLDIETPLKNTFYTASIMNSRNHPKMD